MTCHFLKFSTALQGNLLEAISPVAALQDTHTYTDTRLPVHICVFLVKYIQKNIRFAPSCLDLTIELNLK